MSTLDIFLFFFFHNVGVKTTFLFYLDIATPLFFKEELGISYLGFGSAMSAMSIFGAVAKLSAGKFTDVHGRRSTLLLSTFAAGICMVVIGFITGELQFITTRGIGSLFESFSIHMAQKVSI